MADTATFGDGRSGDPDADPNGMVAVGDVVLVGWPDGSFNRVW